MRNPVGAHDLEAARLASECVERGTNGLYYKVALVTSDVIGPFACDVDG